MNSATILETVKNLVTESGYTDITIEVTDKAITLTGPRMHALANLNRTVAPAVRTIRACKPTTFGTTDNGQARATIRFA